MFFLGFQHRSGHDDCFQPATGRICPTLGCDTQRLLACPLYRFCDQWHHEHDRMAANARRCSVHPLRSRAVLYRNMPCMVAQLEIPPCGHQMISIACETGSIWSVGYLILHSILSRRLANGLCPSCPSLKAIITLFSTVLESTAVFFQHTMRSSAESASSLIKILPSSFNLIKFSTLYSVSLE